MPRSITSPDRLFDRTWRPGHPFSPRLSATRKWGMGFLFLFLSAIIGGYGYITDSVRVKQMAEAALTDVLGGRVTVGSATLSVFEGLRIDDVRLMVDDKKSQQRDDSVLFSAATFLVQHNPQALLYGKIEPTRIIAIDPHLYLIEDTETGRWNYQRLTRRPPTSTEPVEPRGTPFAPPTLPEIALRNAKVEYGQRGKGKLTSLGSIEMEGQLTPALEPEVYLFKLQSRGQNEGVGPTVKGSIVMSTRQLTASLMNFSFGRDVRTMLPTPVRSWWDAHQLDGRLDVTDLYYKPTSEWDKPEFRVAIELKGVTLQVRPDEWMTDQEKRRVAWMQESMQVMRQAGLNRRGFVDSIASVVTPTPITLKKVSGRFIFTDRDGIEIQDVNGHVENNGLKISGRLRAYAPARPDLKQTIRISSLDTEDILVPPAPRYINAMPDVVREIYDHLRPQGRCSFWVQVALPEPGERLKMNGEINILDGQFVFDKFPYPVRRATGKLVFGNNPKSGWEQLEIVGIRGHGIEGGPNEDADLRISGLISPFGPETGVTVNIVGNNIYSEPVLFSAFPPETQSALKLFDAPGKGEFPKFRGGFACDVHRPVGLRQHWKIETRIRLDEATGRLVVFPYPMEGVSGTLTVRDDNVKIEHAVMKRGDSTLQLNGQVSWHSTPGPSDEEEHILRPRATTQPSDRMLSPRVADTQPIDVPPLRPELTIVATNVPIDKDLLDSLPPDQSQWLQKIGLGGKLDINGVIRNAPPSHKDPRGADIDLDLGVTLKDGTLWPTAGTFAVTDLAGRFKLMPQRLTVSELRGKRGQADLFGRGSVNWSGGTPQVVLSAEANNLLLDPSLYALLPGPAKAGWDQVHPEGTLDARISYSGKAAEPSAAATEPANSNANAYEVLLTPRELSATPTATPYRLDKLTGSVLVLPDKVVLQDLTGKHGAGTVRISGTGSTDADGKWDLKLSGQDIDADAEFRKAVPDSLGEMLKSAELKGKIAFDFSKLLLSPAAPPVVPSTAAIASSALAPSLAATSLPATTPSTRPNGPPLDVDFAVKVTTADASVNLGVPMAKLAGAIDLSGTTRNSRLARLDGTVDFPTLSIAGRPVTDLRAKLAKQETLPLLQVSKLEAQLAGGSLAGQVDYAFPDNSSSRYALRLDLRNADVETLTGERADIHGRLSASLALEGAYDDLKSRRGRGDVSVDGDKLLKLPLVLGLLQITNLALPIAEPFNQATARYSVEGERVTFEQLEMRAKDMMMQGSGHLDFGTKQVRMTFVTDSAAWAKVPIVGELLQGARHELLQIQVRGTLQEPKVSASAMNTFTTTIDEVFRGDGAAKKRSK